MEGSKSTSVEQKMVFSLGMGESLPLAQVTRNQVTPKVVVVIFWIKF